MTTGPLQWQMARARIDELHRVANARRRLPDPPPPTAPPEPVTLRFGFPDDAQAITRLAMLDSTKPPPQPLLVAEVAGELCAALSLATGAVVADPFRSTTAVVELLRARARQLAPTTPRRFRSIALFRRLTPERDVGA